VASDTFFQNISRIEPGIRLKFEIASKAGCQRGREVLARFKSIIFRLASSFMPLKKGSLVRVGILSNVIGWLTT
jgi:hypothetical protein